MRWDQIRQGLLAGPMQPGATADLRKIAHAEVDPWTPRVNATIGPEGQDQLQTAQAVTQLSQTLGVPVQGTTELAQQHLRGALRDAPAFNYPGPPPGEKDSQPILNELSNIVQGKDIGTQFWQRNEPEEITAEEFENKTTPLQRMRSTDPSYGDLFRRRR